MAMTDSESSYVSSASSVAIRSYRDGPPWIFKGRALYQLHAVKSSVARRFVPPELKLVEAFGYTLGGLFLANYDGSPAGQFDEAVVIAGIVWNPPTSCAWAGRVLVGSEEARVHGRQGVGLPSHLACFSHRVVTSSISPANPPSPPSRPWWDARAWFSSFSSRVGAQTQRQKLKSKYSVEIVQIGNGGTTALPLCEILGIPRVLPAEVDLSASSPSSRGKGQRWRAPAVQLYLPNFSGKTRDQPKLLKYSCAVNCRVSVVATARITDLTSGRLTPTGAGTEEDEDDELRTGDVVSILKGKPLASIFFDEMVMRVEAPKLLVFEDSRNKQTNQKKLLNPTTADIDHPLGVTRSAS